MSDSDKPQDDAAPDTEPVDAEFEPAPDEASGDDAGHGARGAGPVKLALFVVAAALIGGTAAFALSRYLPPQAVPGDALTGLEDRLTALESRDGPDLSRIEERVSRLESVFQARQALPSRVAALETAVADLEAAAGGAATSGGAPESLDALRSRLDQAFSSVRARLDSLEDAVETVRAEAETARSAARQAGAALADIGSGEAGAAPDQRLAALSGRVDALDDALGQVRRSTAALEDLRDRVDALAEAVDSADPGDGATLSDLRTRIQNLARETARLTERVDALERGPAAAPEPAGLAARALAFAALSEAASNDAPFAVELEALARVWPGAPGLEALRAVAREGAPTPDRLEDTFPAEALREATGETTTYFGVLRVAREEDAGPAARIETALAEDDLAAAADIVSDLDDAAAAALGGWRAGLLDRLRVREALSAQSAALASAGDEP